MFSQWAACGTYVRTDGRTQSSYRIGGPRRQKSRVNNAKNKMLLLLLGDVNNSFSVQTSEVFWSVKKLLRSVFNASKNFGTFLLRTHAYSTEDKRLTLIIQLDELSWRILNPFALHALQSSPSRLAKSDLNGPDQCAAAGHRWSYTTHPVFLRKQFKIIKKTSEFWWRALKELRKFEWEVLQINVHPDT